MPAPQFDYTRRAQREPAIGSATLSGESQGAPFVYIVRLRNLSADGMQAVGPRQVDPGTPVFVSGVQYECAGEIRYCQPEGAEFCFGLEFRSDPYPLQPEGPLQ